MRRIHFRPVTWTGYVACGRSYGKHARTTDAILKVTCCKCCAALILARLRG